MPRKWIWTCSAAALVAGVAGHANGQSYGKPVGPRVPYGTLTPVPVAIAPMLPVVPDKDLTTAPVFPASSGEPAAIVPVAAPVVAAPLKARPAGAAPRTILETVDEKHREAVGAVLRQPTLSARAVGDEFTAQPKVYDWLLEHPDRTCLAWQRLKVPCISIADMGKGQFNWIDDSGSELTWQTVGRFENGVIWYAVGKVKPGVLMPAVPVKAVAVLHSPRTEPDTTGAAMISPTLQVYVLSDSRVANMVTKMAGQSAPRLAEQGAEQLLYFFAGIARQLQRKPDLIEVLLAAPKK